MSTYINNDQNEDFLIVVGNDMKVIKKHGDLNIQYISNQSYYTTTTKSHIL